MKRRRNMRRHLLRKNLMSLNLLDTNALRKGKTRRIQGGVVKEGMINIASVRIGILRNSQERTNSPRRRMRFTLRARGRRILREEAALKEAGVAFKVKRGDMAISGKAVKKVMRWENRESTLPPAIERLLMIKLRKRRTKLRRRRRQRTPKKKKRKQKSLL
jgi:hypothetical protein